jgi:hypothetical protein
VDIRLSRSTSILGEVLKDGEVGRYGEPVSFGDEICLCPATGGGTLSAGGVKE